MIENQQQDVDIFQWANRVDGIKNELTIELFIFNRNYTPYFLDYAKATEARIKALFLYDIINYIQLGAGTGLAIKPFESSEGAENTLEYTDLSNVGRAETLIHIITNEAQEMVHFSAHEHEVKRQRGIIARFTAPDRSVFYVTKGLTSSSYMRPETAFALSDDGVIDNTDATMLKIAPENQTLIVDGRVFVFNEAKFAATFEHDARREAILENKIAALEKRFKLVYPEGVTLRDLAAHSKQLTNKLLKINPESATQDQVVTQADEFGVELMTDDAGAIIILDARDAVVFLNTLNDDYMASDMTGLQYLVTSKRTINESGDNQTRMDVR